ncbi:MAG: hypothetical protein IJ593_02920 [Lachnospiraceae bacterium]|nr:hypothetical protein [Lachnospiraceae bacterium]
MNKNAIYEIIGRQTDGVKVSGYVLHNCMTGVNEIVTRDECYSMAMNKQIKNITVQIYDGKVTMKGVNYKVSELPRYDMNGNRIVIEEAPKVVNKIFVTGKIYNGKHIDKYRVTLFTNGKPVDNRIITKDELYELAAKGKIANARCQKLNNEYILRGINYNLSKLPVLEIREA